MNTGRLAKYAWGVLVYNLLVIMWGAYVRATGSGAGCGNHWPLCNGEVLPRARQVETMIEFSHRLSSGLALLAIIGLFVWVWRRYPGGHRVRTGAVFSLVFIIAEAIFGAGLVLFELVAENTSAARAVAMAVHLVNTFLLLAALTMTAWWASGGPAVRLRRSDRLAWALLVGFAGMLVLAASGGVTALGDTLFPAASLREGLIQDLSPTTHILIRLRLFHPLIAILVGLYLVIVGAICRLARPSPYTRQLSHLLTVVYMVQLVAGALNVALLAPVWLQMVHLLLSDLVWIVLVLLGANTLAVEAEVEKERVLSPSAGTAV
ncbi:MAG: heme A synthase [Chloroflexi bacterium]|nr:MAG: heme A synthase [Chloroflexota bacterium]